LLGQVEDLIRDKHLLVVPSGPLTQLPFQTLVASLPDAEATGDKPRTIGRIAVQFGELPNDARKKLGGLGVAVIKPDPGGPGDTAGIKAGDTLLSVDGEDVASARQAIDAIRAHAPGSSLPLRVLRERTEIKVVATPIAATVQEWVPRFLKPAPELRVDWLTRRHAITVLPAVSSLKALRRVARPSAATKPMIGFGNPLLDGNPRERPWELRWAALAREKQTCKGLEPSQQVAATTRRTRGVLHVAMRNGHADVTDLASQVPLPDTADELCTAARELKLAPDDILLGANATETNIKRLSGEGKLAQYHVLHFATHGTLAGEITGTSEPGLIFTPPKQQSDLDDGYLSASEVAAIKLDADWVILSACNTAAGGAQGAEALSGLARAFFYAGARAMLVSHWSVDSAATVQLITSAVGATTHDKTLGRAEALRRAMLAMIDKGEPRQAHPAYWAPFVVVGEGSAQEHGATALPPDRRPPPSKRATTPDWRVEIWQR
jgi:CHAT domain-containing protein